MIAPIPAPPARAGLLSVALLALLAAPTRAQTGAVAARQSVINRNRLPATVNEAIVKGSVIAVTPAGDSTPVDPAKSMVTVQANQLLLGRRDAATEIADARIVERLKGLGGVAPSADVEAKDLPIFTVERAPDGTTLRTIQPYILISRLRYERTERQFAGPARIGVRIIDAGNGGRTALEKEIGFSLTSDDADVDTPRLTFKEANGAPAMVKLTTRTPVDSVLLRLTRDDVAGSDMVVAIQLQPVLHFEGVPARIQAFGLEKRAFTVGIRGAALPKPAQVQLGLSGAGELEPRTLSLSSGEVATLSVTADEIGTMALTASAQGLAMAEAPIDAGFPWRYVMATLAGALIGAGWAWSSIKTKGRRKSPVKLVIAAILGAVIGAAAAIGLGLNLSWFQVGAVKTTIAVFAFAALVAAGGLKVVPWQDAKSSSPPTG